VLQVGVPKAMNRVHGKGKLPKPGKAE
jgi:hypothetical protein